MNLDAKILLSEAKSLLKIKKLRYSDLTDELAMSESGVKRLFNSDDCSFSRLSEIFEALGTSLSDVIVELEKREVEHFEFSSAEEKFLYLNPQAFKFGWKLIFERMSAEEIREKYNLSKVKVFTYLKALDLFGHIELGPNNKVKLPKLRPVRTDFRKGYFNKVFSEWSEKLLSDVLSNKEADERQFSLSYHRLTKDGYEELLQKYDELDKEFHRRTINAIATKDLDDLIMVRKVSAISEGSFCPHL